MLPEDLCPFGLGGPVLLPSMLLPAADAADNDDGRVRAWRGLSSLTRASSRCFTFSRVPGGKLCPTCAAALAVVFDACEVLAADAFASPLGVFPSEPDHALSDSGTSSSDEKPSSSVPAELLRLTGAGFLWGICSLPGGFFFLSELEISPPAAVARDPLMPPFVFALSGARPGASFAAWCFGGLPENAASSALAC